MAGVPRSEAAKPYRRGVERGSKVLGKRIEERRVCLVGPGLKTALGQLGDPGQALVARWSALSEVGLLEEEAAAVRLSPPEAARYDESQPGTRWLAYGRTGVACALLRQAGRQARGTDADRAAAERQ